VMGGLRSTTIMTAKVVAAASQPRHSTLPHKTLTQTLFQGATRDEHSEGRAVFTASDHSINAQETSDVQHGEGAEESRCLIATMGAFWLSLARISVVSAVWVIAGSLVATPLLFRGDFSREVCLRNGERADSGVAEQVAEYGRQFSWGVLPTLWLYFADQLCLGVQAAGLSFVYGGFAYALVATVAAGSTYSSSWGVAGLGAAMSLGAWVALALLTLHMLLDRTLRGLVAAPILLVKKLLLRESCGERRLLVPVAREFLRLALPLALSNCLGLLRGLVVAATITSVSSDAATSYSIAMAYFETLEIAMLGASSAVSSVASRYGRRLESPAMGREELSEGDVGSEATRRHASIAVPVIASSISVAVLGSLLGVLPLLFPRTFAELFGGKVYAYGESQVDTIDEHDLLAFTWLCFGSFLAAMVAMVSSAVLHGWGVVVLPTALNVAANVVAIAWAIGFDAARQSPALVVAASTVCNGLAAVLQLGLLRVVAQGPVADRSSFY
jgi:Na+-driven multidrug efflux pump